MTEPVPNIAEDLSATNPDGTTSTQVTTRWWKWFSQLVNQLPYYPKTLTEGNAGVTIYNYNDENSPFRYGAKGDNSNDDSSAWTAMGKVSGYHFVYEGTYLFGSKVQTSSTITAEGSDRQLTILSPKAAFADYLMEIGTAPSGPNPNVGAVHRLRFLNGTASNKGMLHMNQLSHMWHLNELLFQSSSCPALVVDDCWDSNYTNIDVLSCGGSGVDPSLNAAVIVKNGCNNVYFRGLRMEQAPGGVVYVGTTGSPIWMVTGKIDQGFISQNAAAVTVAGQNSSLMMSHFSLTGVLSQYYFDITGGLALDSCYVDGGSNKDAAIFDHRAWYHIDSVTSPGTSGPNIRPTIPQLFLDQVNFTRTHPSVSTTTPAAIKSKIFPIRALNNLSVTANGGNTATTRNIATSASISFNDQYTNCFLVHNATGSSYTSRRRILSCFVGGNMTVAGSAALTIDGDYSIEFCGGHYTPNFKAEGVSLQQGQNLFAQLSTGCTLTGSPNYASNPASAAYGTTTIGINGPNLAPNLDVTGFFLIDEQTGDAYLLGYGIDGTGVIGVMYNQTSALTNAITSGHTFTIQCGFNSNVKEVNGGYEWNYAGRKHYVTTSFANNLGFDWFHTPLWDLTELVGAFTGTITGVSPSVSGTVTWVKTDGLVTLSCPSNILGNSNANTLTMTGLPSHLIPATFHQIICGNITDASADYQPAMVQIDTNGLLTFLLGVVSGAKLTYNNGFTAAGVKGIDGGWTITYPLN